MTLTWFLQLLSLGLVLNADTCGGAVPECHFKWFGSRCKYKCHCVNDKCDDKGECNDSYTCERGWFGPACQYVDLVSTNTTSSTPAWVYDFPDTLCNTGQETVTVSLQDTFYFTWLRLHANSTGTSQAFKLQFLSSTGNSVECTNMQTAIVSDTVLDIHCDPGVLFQQLTITGDGVRFLCSVYISGGRNVALGQDTSQTSNYYSNSTLAVDGNRDSNFEHESCSHTDKKDAKPTWTLTFQKPQHVIRYDLYNRDSEQRRLTQFYMEAYQESGRLTFNYTDSTGLNRSIYMINSVTPYIPVAFVKIVATYPDTEGTFLTLCEVEMFGDTVCPTGRYGRECEYNCNCARYREKCFVSTGGCPSGCAPGYQGEGCQNPCGPRYYGNCSQECSTNCKDQLCEPSTGTCMSCVAGKQPPLCEKDCNPTFWGDNCANRCRSDCKNMSCDPINGACSSCEAGKSGVSCDQDCSATYYGENCAMKCSSNCMDQHCYATNGNCQSCVIGKSGLLCDTACISRTFGQDCRQNCSTNCTDHLCDTIEGKCFSCLQGSTGDFCEKMLLVQSPGGSSPPIGVIVGPVVAFAVLVALIVIGVLIWRRRRHRTDEPRQTIPDSFQDYTEIEIRRSTVESKAMTTQQGKAVTVQAKSPVMKKLKVSRDNKDSKNDHGDGVYYNHLPERSETAIRFSDLGSFMASHREGFYQEQFNHIQANSSATTTVALSAENQNKNRYKNIRAYDHSRVHLQTDSVKKHGDYINASYIDGFQQKKQFIASQGPTQIILKDFVRMLWEQEAEVVVMLTNLIEDGKLKCVQYWPDDGEINIGEITVRLATTQVFADYTVRRLCLYKKSQPVQILTHFHFTNWPDKDVPTTAWGLVDLEQRVASVATSKPIIVHCSAGVARTGIFIALRNILEEINKTGYMDVFTTVQKLRQDRINMVQTVQQYEFLHRATQIAMVCKGTTVTPGSIRDRIQFLENSESGQSNLEKEFQSVCLVCCEDDCNDDDEELQEDSTYCNSRMVSNRMKNRFHNVLPKEYYRPVLSCEAEDMGNYINAVLIPSCNKHDHQILTQLPLPTTVVDFWRLVTQYKVALIVAFETDLATEDMTFGDYLPENEEDIKTCSFFNIQTKFLDSCNAWEEQKITITVNEENLSKLTNVSFKDGYSLSHLSWKSTDLDFKNLLTLMGKIRAMKPVGEGRTLFTCRNGAEVSGLASALSLLLDRMDNDQHVSVPFIVGTVKAIRPQIVPTLDQYRLLYQAISLFSDTNKEYINFSSK